MMAFLRARPVLRGVPYPLFAGGLVLLVATAFYASLKLQILYSSVRGDPYLNETDWSAPLDDVFIHFDFARQTARGRPFEWSAGNGYSSGGTSLLYPFVLAPGFWLGFQGGNIVRFAALVACISIFAVLLVSRRLFRDLPPWTVFFAPPLLLGVGALDWSLFSGMEVAFFLAMWAVAFACWDDLVHGEPSSTTETPWRRGALLLGLANGLVVATRPEALTTAVAFAATAAWVLRRRHGTRIGITGFVLATMFGVAVVAAQAIANRILTGDFSAAGALVKLEINDPRLTAREAWDAWVFHVRYQIGRVTGHHLGGSLWVGSLLWAIAAIPFAFAKTRLVAVLLWSQAVAWVLVVALNGQVRWQNERYTMPAVAWMLLAAAVGIGVVCSPLVHERLRRGGRAAARVAVAIAMMVLAFDEASEMRDQIWFFGRASRNIRDQHIKVGRIIQEELKAAHRVLVGDAGAIPFASDMPALDIIGLGGYHDLPFARASRWGVGAAIELIERIPPASRPDLMAIYPNWWGDFPLWFGAPLDGVSVRGNVICGGLTKMLYAARWNALDIQQRPVTPLPPTDRVVDAIDFADIISEKAHGYAMDGALGYVAMKLLNATGPGRPREVWDAGRITVPGVSIRFGLAGFTPGKEVRLLVRTAPSHPAHVLAAVGKGAPLRVEIRPTDSWVEASIIVPAEQVAEKMPVTVTVEGGEVVLYHLWAIEAR